MDFQSWAKETGAEPRMSIGEWLRRTPDAASQIAAALEQGYSWEQATDYALAQGSPPTDRYTLRKAVERLG